LRRIHLIRDISFLFMEEDIDLQDDYNLLQLFTFF